MSGKGALGLWPLFGAVNQLLGGLALLVITSYLIKRKAYSSLITGVPCILVLMMTLWATLSNQRLFWQQEKWLLLGVNSIIIGLAVFICIETGAIISQMIAKRKQRVMA